MDKLSVMQAFQRIVERGSLALGHGSGRLIALAAIAAGERGGQRKQRGGRGDESGHGREG